MSIENLRSAGLAMDKATAKYNAMARMVLPKGTSVFVVVRVTTGKVWFEGTVQTWVHDAAEVCVKPNEQTVSNLLVRLYGWAPQYGYYRTSIEDVFTERQSFMVEELSSPATVNGN